MPLTPEQQKALMDAGQVAEDFFFEEAKGLDNELVEVYKKAGVQINPMTKEDYDAWVAVAQKSSYKIFAENVPGGAEIIEKALAVE